MKKIILLVSLCLVFTQELKVEGDLRVNGVVLNTKVDSLEFLIDSLQIQINTQQTLIEQLESSNSNHQSLISSLQSLINSLQSQITQLQIQTGITDCNGEIGGDAIEDICGVCDGDNSSCSNLVDIEGNEYETVIIGDQLWMAENLKVQLYNNGDGISQNGETQNYWSYDDNGDYKDIYGYLYNWYAVNDERGICPEGWHIPSNQDYQILIDYLYPNPGTKLKSEYDWDGTNLSGFNALPGGFRHPNTGSFYNENQSGYWWSIDMDLVNDAYRIELNRENSSVIFSTSLLNTGYSVRCIKD